MLSLWGSSNYRPSAPFLQEVASHVKTVISAIIIIVTNRARTDDGLAPPARSCARQEWLFDVGGHAVEAGRAAVVHPRPPLARGGVCWAPRPPAEADGGGHDRGRCKEVSSQFLMTVTSNVCVIANLA